MLVEQCQPILSKQFHDIIMKNSFHVVELLLIVNKTCKKDHQKKVIPMFFLNRYFDIPMEILPKVRSSSEIYGLMVSWISVFVTLVWETQIN